MPDGLLTARSPKSQARTPALAGLFERLIACAERGAHPDAVLRDIRALMRDHGLLLQRGGEAE